VKQQGDRPPDNKEYDVELYASRELSPAELAACSTIIVDGGAVDAKAMKRHLPNCTAFAIARTGEQIVGVGAIKAVRKDYTAKVAKNSGVDLPPHTPELGYVAVHRDHRNRGLAQRIATELASRMAGRLFATTDDERMKRILSNAGFVKKGKEWKGRRGIISYWEKAEAHRLSKSLG
jgi:RimJ/RimL family protein N-acetyltransferase